MGAGRNSREDMVSDPSERLAKLHADKARQARRMLIVLGVVYALAFTGLGAVVAMALKINLGMEP